MRTLPGDLCDSHEMHLTTHLCRGHMQTLSKACLCLMKITSPSRQWYSPRAPSDGIDRFAASDPLPASMSSRSPVKPYRRNCRESFKSPSDGGRTKRWGYNGSTSLKNRGPRLLPTNPPWTVSKASVPSSCSRHTTCSPKA